jgi:hypothetical protein
MRHPVTGEERHPDNQTGAMRSPHSGQGVSLHLLLRRREPSVGAGDNFARGLPHVHMTSGVEGSLCLGRVLS